jgi:hypothetical protein
MTTEYPRGSEWRRWDLHFHTPSSYDAKNVSNQKIVECWKNNCLSVVAITDHHIMDLDRIGELTALAHDENITVLPGIEFLSDARGREPIHFIGIFPETSSIKDIWGEILYCTNLKKLNTKNPNEIYCNLLETVELIHRLGGIVTIHAGSKSNSLENITNSLPHSEAQKEDIFNVVDMFEVGKVEDIESYENYVFKSMGRKSLILCSDNHDVDKYNVKMPLWIKADPNFAGLKQAILEPDRICIRETPFATDRITHNSTKILKSLSITWADGYAGNRGKWFKDISIDFNPEMSVIIGNKGSGKTAIAEITALLSNTKNEKDFVFLNSQKFRQKGLAKNFIANLKWNADGVECMKNLNETIDNTSPELVHFVPQKSFEKYCNDSDEEFVSEINNVVFSRMNNEDKLGFNNFSSLVENQKGPIKLKREELSIQVKNINEKIKELEQERDEEVVSLYRKQYDQINIEIEEHANIKPIKVFPPKDLNTPEYNSLMAKKKTLENIINDKELEKNELTKQLSQISLIRTMIENLKDSIDNRSSDIQKHLSDLDISMDDILNYKISLTPLQNKYNNIMERKNKLLGEINTSEEGGDLGSLIEEKKKIETKMERFNNENKGKLTAYQKYIEESAAWRQKNDLLQNKKKEIGLKLKELGDLSDSELIKKIQELRRERYNIITNIFHCIEKEVEIYRKFKQSIINFINTYKIQIAQYDISIESGIYLKSDFIKNFNENYIDNSVAGPFRGEDGMKKIKEITEKYDFNSLEQTTDFIKELENEFDNFNPKKCFHSMYKKNQYENFWNYLCNLNFIDSRYSLRLYGKSLNELSPGERGSLLLIFYLLLDARDIPLILDQPEDNLDNESVAKILVPFIKEAKKRRQLIIITHNANLAVVSDAEQVIRVNIDKKHDYTFSYDSGSLESCIINDVVNVLEGTKTSFNKRHDKYEIAGVTYA